MKEVRDHIRCTDNNKQKQQLQAQLHTARIRFLSFRRKLRRMKLFISGRKIAKAKPPHEIVSMQTVSPLSASSSSGVPSEEADSATTDVHEMAPLVKDVYEENGGCSETVSKHACDETLSSFDGCGLTFDYPALDKCLCNIKKRNVLDSSGGNCCPRQAVKVFNKLGVENSWVQSLVVAGDRNSKIKGYDPSTENQVHSSSSVSVKADGPVVWY